MATRKKTVEPTINVLDHVLKECINHSYLQPMTSEDEFYQDVEKLFSPYEYMDNKVALAFYRYNVYKTIRFYNLHHCGIAVPIKDELNKIHDIIEFITFNNFCTHPMLDGHCAEIAFDLWDKSLNYYYDEEWGDKVVLTGKEIMEKNGYTLWNNKKYFIGQQLLVRDKQRPVMIFDDFLSALIYSIIDETHICLARGQSDMNVAPELTSPETKELLKGRDVKYMQVFDYDFPSYAEYFHSLKNEVALEKIIEKTYKHAKKLKL